ncbi:Na+/H+ antiporter subunit E [Pseudactinotalea sp.]|uniref:Na+/H+ antiporter subunit E n=1 Tax=Pseudactinotalea sp. TaxID=1926260 RepID=UPI003B3B7B1E
MSAALTLPLRVVAFTAWFAWQVIRSSAQVLADVLTPGSRATPRVVRLELGRAADLHTTAISVLITLTPGTLVLGHDSDSERSVVLVHSMYHRSTEQALADLLDMDRRLLHSWSLRRTP